MFVSFPFFNTIKILFYLQSQKIWHFIVYLDVSSCLLSHCVACGGRMVVGGHLFFFFSLSWHVKYTTILFVFCFSILVLIFYISYFVIVPFIFVFLFYNLSCVLFSIPVLFLFFSLAFLFTFFWLSISSFNQSFCCFIFFQFDPDSFDLFFLLLKLFSQINLTIQLKFFLPSN